MGGAPKISMPAASPSHAVAFSRMCPPKLQPTKIPVEAPTFRTTSATISA
jgi:hypothetical protein